MTQYLRVLAARALGQLSAIRPYVVEGAQLPEPALLSLEQPGVELAARRETVLPERTSAPQSRNLSQTPKPSPKPMGEAADVAPEIAKAENHGVALSFAVNDADGENSDDTRNLSRADSTIVRAASRAGARPAARVFAEQHLLAGEQDHTQPVADRSHATERRVDATGSNIATPTSTVTAPIEKTGHAPRSAITAGRPEVPYIAAAALTSLPSKPGTLTGTHAAPVRQNPASAVERPHPETRETTNLEEQHARSTLGENHEAVQSTPQRARPDAETAPSPRYKTRRTEEFFRPARQRPREAKPEAADSSDPSGDVHIHIGRVELTAVASAVSQPREKLPAPKRLSLGDYLNRRTGDGR